MTIRRLRLIAFTGSFLLVAASVVVTLWALRAQQDDALVINLAGRQRMFIQQITLEVLGVQIGANPIYRQTLHQTADSFEQTLNALTYGGQAPDPEGTIVTLPSAPAYETEIPAQLETVRATWSEIHPAIHAVLQSAPQSATLAEAAATVVRLSPVLLEQMDKAARLYVTEAQRTVAFTQAVQLGFLGATAALLAIAFVITEQRLLKPLAWLGAAAQRIGRGDLETPVSIAGLGEIDELAHGLDDMRRRLGASAETHTALLAFSRRLLAAKDERAVAECAVEAASFALQADFSALVLLDAQGRLLTRAVHGWPADFAGRFELGRGDASQTGYTILRGHPVAVEDYSAEGAFTVPPTVFEYGIVSGLSVPMLLEGRIVGAMLVHLRTRREFSEDEIHALTLIANQTAIALEKAQLFAEVQNLAITDGLTGLTNRRHFLELAGREFERSRRYDRPLSAIMLDIDRFKRVNDTYGHAVGDQVLQTLAARFRANVRDIDLLGRYGGEEFAALLPEVGLERARVAAERLRQSVAETPIETAAGPLSVTISLGVGAIHVGAIHELPVPGAPDCPDLPTLLRLADEALYAAKNAGGNRVVTNEPGLVSSGGA